MDKCTNYSNHILLRLTRVTPVCRTFEAFAKTSLNTFWILARNLMLLSISNIFDYARAIKNKNYYSRRLNFKNDYGAYLPFSYGYYWAVPTNIFVPRRIRYYKTITCSIFPFFWRARDRCTYVTEMTPRDDNARYNNKAIMTSAEVHSIGTHWRQ